MDKLMMEVKKIYGGDEEQQFSAAIFPLLKLFFSSWVIEQITTKKG
jgi:hypothetical protein